MCIDDYGLEHDVGMAVFALEADVRHLSQLADNPQARAMLSADSASLQSCLSQLSLLVQRLEHKVAA